MAYIISIGIILSIIITYVAFGEYVYKFYKWITKKSSKEKKICSKIFSWFSFIDKNLTENGINLIKLNSIEKEIDFYFNIDKNSKLKLNFSKSFINKYLKFCGLKSEFWTQENFIKFAHIRNNNLQLILELETEVQKKKISEFNIPLNVYWNIVKGNFYNFHRQYITNWKDIKKDEKLTFADIEMPIKLLKMYYKEY